ncbi:MAG: response regulator receiver domain, partial [Patescibacteria group bacterium]
MPSLPAFEELSRQIAADFLQSVVVVDDLAFFYESDLPDPHPLSTPTRGNVKVPAQAHAGPNTVGEASHKLDAKALIDGFADRGLVCSVLRPKYQEQFQARTIKTAQRADILVLDWQIQGTLGENVSGFVSTILGDSTDRIRLIAIYTAESLSHVRDDLAEVVQSVGSCVEEDAGYVLIQGATRICIFAKEGCIAAPTQQIVTVQQLPDRLISEFTKATMGLLSNVALKSLAAVRKNTHRILGRFHRGLDAPYLTHRMLLQIPQDAEEFLAYLAGEELQAIIEESNVCNAVNIEAIRHWLEWKKPIAGYYTFRDGNNVQNWSIDQIVDMLEQGIANIDKEVLRSSYGLSKGKDHHHKLPLTATFDNAPSLDEDFAHLTVLRSVYYDQAPTLTLGTLLEMVGDNPSYLVCIQPRCDCVRIGDDRAFPFLPLSVVT